MSTKIKLEILDNKYKWEYNTYVNFVCKKIIIKMEEKVMYIIITKEKNFADYALKAGYDVFRDDELIIVGKTDRKLEVETLLTSLLGMLAIDPDLLGYEYIKHILHKCVEKEGYYRNGMTKAVYPECAKHYGTTSERVERAIRHAIETGFYEVPDKYNKLFSRQLEDSPANSKFISMLAVHLKNALSKL